MTAPAGSLRSSETNPLITRRAVSLRQTETLGRKRDEWAATTGRTQVSVTSSRKGGETTPSPKPLQILREQTKTPRRQALARSRQPRDATSRSPVPRRVRRGQPSRPLIRPPEGRPAGPAAARV